ncbi:MAG TPA: sugar phosphate isomerase/epimerase [Planctomycetota bacterium]
MMTMLALSAVEGLLALVLQDAAFEGPPGIQLYSLRDLFKAEGPKAGLDKTKELGFKLVELAGTYGLPPADFLKLLEERGLKAVSGHFPYARWLKDPEGVAAEAKALGLEYAGCAWADHKDPFDPAQAHQVVEAFNKAGAACTKAGLRFFYHFHGFEFHKHGDGTLADMIIQASDPDHVSFQLDVLWILFPGHDPAALLAKYPGRWVSMHLKDLKKGIATGALTGKTDVRNDVVLGTGQADWPTILRAAKKAGVKYYFIEDESPDVLKQIPATLQYLKDVRF